MMRQALENAEPPEREQVERARLVIGPLCSFSDAMLEADRNVPSKYCHAAHHIC
jgi:hypothetical protein